ncbi:hypothetical protein BS50DRAFT_44348 [Corynespora cassiicola Philippines]|uniref:Uncharacterized protein n=1 Tax=Corynespora cassiicola Philippines TaxID=1448308 RepID=A0A2T2PDA1_CORCC|nr:hypothetical protein BS50DRAFT_44348 [Corynespora cassiicola Philippines]
MAQGTAARVYCITRNLGVSLACAITASPLQGTRSCRRSRLSTTEFVPGALIYITRPRIIPLHVLQSPLPDRVSCLSRVSPPLHHPPPHSALAHKPARHTTPPIRANLFFACPRLLLPDSHVLAHPPSGLRAHHLLSRSSYRTHDGDRRILSATGTLRHVGPSFITIFISIIWPVETTPSHCSVISCVPREHSICLFQPTPPASGSLPLHPPRLMIPVHRAGY